MSHRTSQSLFHMSENTKFYAAGSKAQTYIGRIPGNPDKVLLRHHPFAIDLSEESATYIVDQLSLKYEKAYASFGHRMPRLIDYAVIKDRKGVVRAYAQIFEFLDGPTLGQLNEKSLSTKQCSDLRKLLKELRTSRWVHGDLQIGNLIWHKNRWFLIDNEQMHKIQGVAYDSSDQNPEVSHVARISMSCRARRTKARAKTRKNRMSSPS